MNFLPIIKSLIGQSQVPGIPGSLTAIAQSSTSVILSFTASTGDVTRYEYAFATTESALGTPTWHQSNNALRIVVTALNPQTEYFFIVRAVGPGGNSSPSNTADATTPQSLARSVRAVFGVTTVDNSEETAETSVLFERNGRNADIRPSSFTTQDVAVTSAPAGVDYTIQRVGGTDSSADRYLIEWTLPDNVSGTVNFTLMGSVLDAGTEKFITATPSSFTFNTVHDPPPQVLSVNATFAPTTVNNRLKTAVTRVTFSRAIIPSSFVTGDVTHSGVAGVDFVIARINGTSAEASIFELRWTLPANSSGTQTFDITGDIQIRTGVIGVQSQDRSVVVDPGSFTFSTPAEPVTAGITSPSGVQTAPYDITIIFARAVTGMALSKLTATNATLSNLRGSGTTYMVRVTPTSDSVGTNVIDFVEGATVTVNSQSVSVSVGSVTVNFDTRTALTATFGTGVVNAQARTLVVRVTFARAIVVSSFTVSDLQIGTPQGVSVTTSIAQVGSGSTATQFDITINLPEDSTGSISYDVQGRVIEGSISRAVQISEGSTNYTTFPANITPRLVGETTGITGDFSLEVVFPQTGISGFAASDVSISQSGVSVVVTSLGSGRFRLDFTGLPTEQSGSFTLDLVGVVTVAGSGTRNLVFDAVTISYDTRTPIVAEFTGFAGVKTGDFSIGIDFTGLDPVSGLEKTDISIIYVSGDQPTTLGINDYTISADGSGNNYTLAFTPASGVSGVFEIDIVGRVNVGASGSQVMKLVSIPAVQIGINTTATPGSTGTPIVIIGRPETRPGRPSGQPVMGTVTVDITWDRDVGTDFIASDIEILEIVGGNFRAYNPLASNLVNVGTTGTTSHFRLTYIPPPNESGTAVIDVSAGAVGESILTSRIFLYDTRPPQVKPAPPTWDVPNGTVFDSTAPFNVDLTFQEDVDGLAITDFIIDGITNHTTLLYTLAADGTETLHTTTNRFRRYRLKIRPHARQQGSVSITLNADSVTNVDAVMGPESPSISPPIPYDTVPMPEPEPVVVPVEAAWVAFPTEITDDTPQNFDIQFSRDVTGLIISDFDVFGLDTNRLFILYKVIDGTESFHTDPTDAASLYRIKTTVRGQQEGTLWFSLKQNSVSASDDGTMGPAVSVTSPGIPYDTIPEPEPEVEPASVEIDLPERPVGTYALQPISEAVTIDITWSEDFEAFAGNVVEIYETGSGPHNALNANLANVGATGTFTHFRLTYTPPDDRKGVVNIRVPGGLYKDNAEATGHSITFDTTSEPDPVVATPTIDRWDVSQGNRFGEDFVYTAFFDRAIGNTVAQIRSALDIEGVDLDTTDIDAVAIVKAADNLSVTITLTPDAAFEGSIVVGIDEDILINVE